MEQSASWEADSHSAGQGISRSLWNPKVHYRAHKIPPLVHILCHLYPIQTFPPYFHNIHFNIILPSTPMSSEWSLPFRFIDKNIVCISHFPMCATCPSYLILLPLITLIIYGEPHVMKVLIMQSSQFPSYFLPLRSEYVIKQVKLVFLYKFFNSAWEQKGVVVRRNKLKVFTEIFEWLLLAQFRDQWWYLGNTVMNL